ncbi:tyrosine-type recombinase/integrase [Clostridium botulinum]|uniref:tyrosine-type recombinase/integrase n=1 Tax=Clostridium botulinum TaxID=1491 RepID=UPI001C9A38D9|nr:tyrosine-type recombinase/integrase [Clostridium botulinum]MBY6948377.1 tyrosine-type recombinase/integrase [Clostridium botulinum]MBY7021410.1 tyrosine-type recombinase/integrase [Clostridium botulinum]
MKKIRMNYKNDKTFKDGFEEFILNCRSRNLRDGTIKHYQESYRQIVKYFDEDILLSDIGKKVFEEFILRIEKNKDINSQTLYTYSRDLKTIINFFINMEYTPMFKIILPKADKHPIETYSDEELEKMLKKPNLKKCEFVEYRNYVICSFFLSTGIRLTSLINIKISDLNISEEYVNIIHTKNRKALTIPLNNNIIKIIKEYLNYRQYSNLDDYLFCNIYGKQLTKSALTQALSSYNKSKGIEHTGIHRLRHTFAKKWILSGNSVVSLRKILGHSSLEMTQNYVNILVSDLKKDVEKYNILQEFNNAFIKIKNKK